MASTPPMMSPRAADTGSGSVPASPAVALGSPFQRLRSGLFGGGASMADFSVRDAFDAFDMDGNGELDVTELRAALCDLGTVRPLRLSREEVDVLVSVCDADGNGSISFTEFSALLDNRFVVLPGDTLFEISKRVFGKPNRWREIGKVNGIKDPKELKAGAILRIPGVGDIVAPDGDAAPSSSASASAAAVDDGTPLRLKQRPPPSSTSAPQGGGRVKAEEDTTFSELLSPGRATREGSTPGNSSRKGRRGGGPHTPLRLAARPPPPDAR